MIKLNQKSNIYVFCPANHETGGTELAHQLVDYLRYNESNAQIVYLKNDEIIEAKVPDGFKKYNIVSTVDIKDQIENIIVLPEIYFKNISKYRTIQFAFWWMSVDNYYYTASFFDAFRFFDYYDFLKFLFGRFRSKNNLLKGFKLRQLKKYSERSIHLYQSAYAREHLVKRGFLNILPLSDYINTDFIKDQNSIQKEDIVLYNPAKGLKFTSKIINQLPQITFIPIKNLKRNELSLLFQRAKLYIDFGNHPGKDRLPREAAINKCCVIVGNKGAACYFEDIPLFSKYKFKNSYKSLPQITRSILNILDDYNNCLVDYDFYRSRILKEKSKFYNEIQEIFLQNDSLDFVK